jgi:ketosteroid isomerase-like protein
VRPLVAVLAAAAALALAGCGGGQSDKQKIESTITSYYKAFGSGDMKAACSHLTADAVKLLESAGRAKCPQVLATALKRPAYARIAPKLKDVRVTGVKVSGANASATAQLPGAGANGTAVNTSVPLTKQGGDWKIVSTAG